jgi:hypothetical protein
MSDDLPEEEDLEHTLVMPFVVCSDQGGPFDSHSFVAGMRLADIQHKLSTRPYEVREYVEPELVPQLDLLAMHEGYNFESRPWDEHPEDWMLARFTFDSVTEETP